MRLTSALASAIALCLLAAPALAQAPAAPTTPAAPAPAVEPAPKAPKAPNPEGVSDEADKALWCGHAFTFVSAQAKAAGDEASATAMSKNGADLIDKGSKLLTDFTPEKLTALKADYSTRIQTELAGDGSNARFSYNDCVALTQ
ncbi:MAG TPA: hypothetical protein VGM83_02695 [Devosiaceae bacterium]|jgi:hypothetical protein